MIAERIRTIRKPVARFFRHLSSLINRFPLRSFLALLLILLLLIIIGNRMRQPETEQEVTTPPKPVETYKISTLPTVRTQGRVEKSGVIDIVAQAPGIVSAIRVTEGQSVKANTQLFRLSTNYQGGNSASLSRRLAQLQHQNILDTYTGNKELIAKQKELAEKNRDNANELRSITEKSLEDTRSLLSLNENVLSTIDSNLTALEQTNVNGVNDSLILSTKQLKSQYQTATVQLRSGLRQSEYQTDEKKPAAGIVDLSRDIAVKQLELQEKALDLTRNTSAIQVKLAAVNEALMYPAAPFAGTVQRVAVRLGQSVTPGTVLGTLVGESKDLKIVAYVPADVAARISPLGESIIYLPHRTIAAATPFVATDATDGTMLPVVYTLATGETHLQDNSYVSIDIPVGQARTPLAGATAGKGAVIATDAAFLAEPSPFLPLDAVFQTQESSYVFVLAGDTVRSRRVKLGNIFGSMVEVTSGLTAQDEVILTRTVLDGEKVTRM